MKHHNANNLCAVAIFEKWLFFYQISSVLAVFKKRLLLDTKELDL